MSKDPDSFSSLFEDVLDKIGEAYQVSEIDVGDFATLPLNPLMKLQSSCYRVEGFGNLSVLYLSAGPVKGITLTLIPLKVDLPLLSVDYMQQFGTLKLHVENYELIISEDDAYHDILQDLQALDAKFCYLQDEEHESSWREAFRPAYQHKTGDKQDAAAMESLVLETVDLYLAHANRQRLLSGKEQYQKAQLVSGYAEKLLEEGSRSTDEYVEKFGLDETRRFYETVVFRTAY